jgi:uncharacterized protein YndB with AHSA1/START domain
MADILHDFPISAPAARVFAAIATPAGLDAWWTARAAGQPEVGAEYVLWFGPEHDWRAVVTRCARDAEIEWRLTRADRDWTGTRVGFQLEERGGVTQVRFSHRGWPQANDHHRTSSFCWAMYLRLMKRHVETGERVPYAQRLDA